jgi:hypothetical protein
MPLGASWQVRLVLIAGKKLMRLSQVWNNGALTVGVVVIALFGTGSLVTRVSVGPLAISAYLTVVMTVFLVAGLLIQISFQRFQQPAWQRGFRSNCFWMALAPICFFLSWAAFSLILSPSIPGAQNVMTMAIFVLGIIFVALNFPLIWIGRYWSAIAYATLAHSLFALASNLFVWQIIDNRAFAMTAVVGLAAMVPLRATNVVLRFAPYIVFVSILISASRTSTFAALCIIGWIVLRDAKPVKLAVVRGALTYLGALVVTVLTYVFYAPASARLEAGDRGVVFPKFGSSIVPNSGSEIVSNSSGANDSAVDIAGPLVLNTNGRIDAWTELVRTVNSPVDWLFGQGSGASALYTRDHMSAFTQSLNEYLRIMVDNGVVGLLVFLAGIIFLIIGLWRNGGYKSLLNQAGLLVIFVTMIASATDGQLIYPFTVIPAAFVIGLAFRSSSEEGQGISSGSVKPPSKFRA